MLIETALQLHIQEEYQILSPYQGQSSQVCSPEIVLEIIGLSLFSGSRILSGGAQFPLKADPLGFGLDQGLYI